VACHEIGNWPCKRSPRYVVGDIVLHIASIRLSILLQNSLLVCSIQHFVIAYCSRRLIGGAGNLQSHSRGEAAVTSNPAIRLLGGCFIKRYWEAFGARITFYSPLPLERRMNEDVNAVRAGVGGKCL
jgi:hypothetical protein